MGGEQVGAIYVVGTIDTKGYDAGKRHIEQGNKELENSSDRASSNMSKGWSQYAKVGIAAAVTATAALTAITVKAAKSSWDQVDSVQQATAMLGRFYPKANDVTKVQKELIKYAQSDMGVLFNRKDLFAAAGNLAMFGVEAKNVSDNVKIMSRLAASGAVSWDDLNSVIGRVISSGKLGRTEWEMLNKAGAGLSDSMANTNVTAEELFKTLDNSVAKDISQDMGNIVPVGIRLDSALRNVGNAILGVNETQDGFMPGSLGQRIQDVRVQLTDLANNAAPKIRQFMEQIPVIMEKVNAAFDRLGEALGIDIDPITVAVGALAGALGGALVAAIWSVSSAILASPLFPIVAIFAAIGIAVALVIKNWKKLEPVVNKVKDAFSKFWDIIKPLRDFVANQFKKAWSDMKKAWDDVMEALKPFMPQLKILGGIILAVLLAPTLLLIAAIGLFVAAIILVITAVARVIGWLAQLGAWFIKLWSDIQQFGLKVVGVFSSIWSKIMSIFNPVINWFKDKFKLALEGVKIIWNTVTSFFSGIWNKIKSAFSAVGTWFRDKFNQATESIRRVFNPIVSWFRTLWNKITSLFGNVGSKIGDTIGGAFKSAINGVLRFAVNMINRFIDSINSAIGIINKLPKVNVPKVGKLPIPQLANGGIVTSPTLAMIGEGRESEAVIPLSKLDAMLNGGGGGTQITQNFYPTNEIDMDVVNRTLTWELSKI